jgi:signal transduction histidine kinase
MPYYSHEQALDPVHFRVARLQADGAHRAGLGSGGPSAPASGDRLPPAARSVLRAILPYVIATVATVVALWITIGLRPIVERNTFMVWLAAIAVSGWLGGLKAGVAATLLSIMGAEYLLFAPTLTLPSAMANLAEVGVLAVLGAFLTWLTHSLRTARENAVGSAARLADQAAMLERQRIELERRMAEAQALSAELTRTNEYLASASAEAQRASQAKSEFLATMSHELRTPLNAIGGYAQLLEIGAYGPIPDAQRDSLERIQRSQQHLLSLINVVLNFTKLEAGQLDYRIESVSLESALGDTELLIAPQIHLKRLTYDRAGGDPTVTVRADRDRLQQILLNLLSNAVKFTEPGGRISLGWEAGHSTVQIRVSDTGSGIAQDQLEAIFQPFVQIGRSLADGEEGTGLGLSISRKLARAMGGEITVVSTLGVGSVFTVSLPRGPAANPGLAGGAVPRSREATGPSAPVAQ